MFFASATDFHYFDFYEWTAAVLFTIMAFFQYLVKFYSNVSYSSI